MTSLMRREIDEIPAALTRLAQPPAQAALKAVAKILRARAPRVVLTVGRGSSDHGASYLKYAIEVSLGVPVASVGPSIATLYGVTPIVPGAAALALSQSGSSADIVALAGALRDGGAHVTALTNTPDSPLGAACNATVDIGAGPERAVAATKSVMSSVVAGLWIVAHWAQDDALAEALTALPGRFRKEGEDTAWPAAAEMLAGTDRAYVIARGAGLGLAQEMALKLIETCRLHATAYSAAEVLHGPSALATDGFAVLALTRDANGALDAPVSQLSRQGARVIAIPSSDAPLHPLVDPLLDLQPFYRMVEALSRRKGFDPDTPAFLAKETSTV